MGSGEALGIELHQLAVIGQEAVDLDLHVGGLRVDGGGETRRADERPQVVDQGQVGLGAASPAS